MHFIQRRLLCAAVILGLLLPTVSMARIKLITLPVRDKVAIQLTHPNATLIQEQRNVPLTQGLNQVDFSWKNTQVDPNSLILQVLSTTDTGEVKVLSVSYPPNEDALVWQVYSQKAGVATLRISYLLSGLNKTFAYRALANVDETTLTLKQFVFIENHANESFTNSLLQLGQGQQFEYDLGLNQTKKLLVEKYSDVPIRKTYTADLSEFGYRNVAQKKLEVPMHYVLTNNTDNQMGKTSLPHGKARIFQQDGKDGQTFVGEDWASFTPRDDEMKLFLGSARDISVKRLIKTNKRQRITGNLFQYHIVVEYEIENFKDQAVRLDVVEHVKALRNEVQKHSNRDVVWEIDKKTTDFPNGLDSEHSDYDKLTFAVDLSARAADGSAEKQRYHLGLFMKNEW